MKIGIGIGMTVGRGGGGESYETPAYENTGGTGDRTATQTVTTTLTLGAGSITTLVNGTIMESVLYLAPQTAAGKVIKIDFGAKKLITEAKWYQSTADVHGTWKWQGSNNDTDYVDIGGNFTLGGVVTMQTLTELSGNVTGYRYYRLLGVSGNTSGGPYLRELEFKIASLLP